ncbi:hypothetical protein C8N25_115111 [Algoriphagus antarcticus]|uniref:Uncharacterized protein n=1 Tax=Algoriphagus antarcticus TaxID=238540 RepID=A0A3E0DRP6_9BACT|nr:hypothetical protein C8N25_115111 [Algoriphagus antarcticus]
MIGTAIKLTRVKFAITIEKSAIEKKALELGA